MKTATELDVIAVAVWRHTDRNRYDAARAELKKLEADTLRDAANRVLEWGKRSGVGFEPYTSKDATDIANMLLMTVPAEACSPKG